jgi:hypothetical protein
MQVINELRTTDVCTDKFARKTKRRLLGFKYLMTYTKLITFHSIPSVTVERETNVSSFIKI